MSSHFCKVGKTRPNLIKSITIKDQITQSVEVVLNKKPPKGFDVVS